MSKGGNFWTGTQLRATSQPRPAAGRMSPPDPAVEADDCTINNPSLPELLISFQCWRMNMLL